MNGVFHRGLKQYVVDRYGQSAWDEAREAAGVDRQVYLPVDSRPDEEFISLVESLPGVVGESPFDLLEAFGRSVASDLLDTYGDRVVRDEWSALDLIERIEGAIHAPLRSHNENLNPPRLATDRPAPDRVIVVYQSGRRLCPVAKGLVLGVGDHYDEPLSVTENRCMHEGAEVCELVVERS